ncbi:MAG: HAD family hydrolase [Rikenellaceae bacterium]
MEQKIKVAIVYDFDGTLSPKNMQEYSFIPELGVTPEEFWHEADVVARGQDGDSVLAYMSCMVEMARQRGIALSKDNFKRWGSAIELYAGVEEWFARINEYGAQRGIEIQHYVNSSGIKEMIEGCKIAEEFYKIYACSFLYNNEGEAYWPGVAINYTNKTQFIFKINKGIETVHDNTRVNEYVEEYLRPIPFRHIIFVGDGMTDIPCMRLVKNGGGYAVAVYDPSHEDVPHTMLPLVQHNRVNHVCKADYRKGEEMDRLLERILDKIKADYYIWQLEVENNNR